jgi:hypothetical protein
LTDTACPARFTRAVACHFIGMAPSALDGWEQAARREADLVLPERLAFSDVLALAVVAEASRRLGARLDNFTVGLAQLFALLAQHPGVERLDGRAALIGHGFARLADLRSPHLHCGGEDLIVAPFRPILASLRDQVFT